MENAEEKPIETIRLTTRDKKRLVEHIDQVTSRPVTPEADKRRLRVSYQAENVFVTVYHANGAQTTFNVLPRNLSTHGLAFLHGRFIYPDSGCKVILPTVEEDGEQIQLSGRIAQCKHVKGVLHEISIVFETSIDLKSFVQLDPEQALRYHRERKHVEYQIGHALVVDDMDVDRQLFGLWLGKIGLTFTEASNRQQALEMLRDWPQTNLILVDIHLGKDDGIALIKELRQMYSGLAIIAVTADTTSAIETQALEAGCSGFLVKPFDPTSLREVIVNTLIGTDNDSSGSGPIKSSKTDDPEMRPLIATFVAGLSGYIQQLEETLKSSDLATALRLCNQLKGAGGSYGYEVVTQLAEQTLQLLQKPSQDELVANKALHDLTAVLRRVSM